MNKNPANAFPFEGKIPYIQRLIDGWINQGAQFPVTAAAVDFGKNSNILVARFDKDQKVDVLFGHTGSEENFHTFMVDNGGRVRHVSLFDGPEAQRQFEQKMMLLNARREYD